MSITETGARQGLTIFFTGLPCAGKTTIAEALQLRLLEQTRRPVTLLDGDVVRKPLSSELGFSKEHRDLNIRRIGFVAAEITRHGGIVICAAVAPYDAVRKEVRAQVESVGGFLLVYVATPLSVCEARDVKGLYARARAGILPVFTGTPAVEWGLVFVYLTIVRKQSNDLLNPEQLRPVAGPRGFHAERKSRSHRHRTRIHPARTGGD